MTRAEHLLIRDQADFYHRGADRRLPSNVHVHVLCLPAYSPELNPVEKLWDLVKDKLCNRLFESLEILEEALPEVLRSFWQRPYHVQRLIGKGWLSLKANSSHATNIPVFIYKWY